MKKLYTLVTTLICALSCVASPLSPQQALQRVVESQPSAERLIGKSGNPQLVLTGKAKGETAYYVFTDASRTLFVSADDIAIPLLGYSDKGNFDPSNMSPELKWWLETYAAEIEYALNNPGYVIAGKGNAEKQSRISGSAIAPLLSTTWDQGEPFNRYCPMLYGERTVTGCVATSMAQVMNYFKWPEAEVNPISYVWNETTTLTSPATVIDWANMRDSYRYNYTEAQADAVARLMQLTGYSVEMMYNISANGGSGAYSINVRSALVDKFGYDQGTDYIQRDYYGADEWAQKIYDNLANIGPVIYNGTGTAGGHSFVCDGYDGNGKFHMNWGWSGNSDGYFVLSALNPSALGTGGGAGGFNFYQGAVIGIRKPQSGSVPPQPVLGCNSSMQGSVSGSRITLTAASGYFLNISPVEGVISLGAQVTNVETGEALSFASPTQNVSLPPSYGWTAYYVSLPSSLAYGTYEVRSIYKVDSGEWQLTRFPVDAVDNFRIVVSASGITMENEPVGEISLKNYDYHSGFRAGGSYNVDATLESSYDVDMDYTLEVYLCTLHETMLNVEETLGVQNVTVPANSETTVTLTGTLSESIEPGTYYLAFINKNSIVDVAEVDVTAAEGGEIRLRAYGINQPFRTGQPYDFFGIASSTMNHDEEYTLDARLCYEENGYVYSVCMLGSSTVNVPAHSEATLEYTGTLDDSIVPGDYYLCFTQGNSILYAIAVEVNDGSGEITIKDYEITSEFKTSEPYSFNVTVESTYEKDYDYGLTASLCTIENDAFSDICSLGYVSVTVPALSEATLDFSGTLDSDIVPGTYYVVLRHGGMILESVEVEVSKGDDGSGDIVLTQWGLEEGFVAGETYEFYVIAESTYKHDVEYSLDAYLCVLEGQSLSIYTNLGNSTVTVPAQSYATFSYSGILNQNIEPGEYYLVWAHDMQLVGNVVVEVTSEGKIICESFTLEPEIVSVGKDSKVTVDLYSTYNKEKTIDFTLYLCQYDPESGYKIRHTYGYASETFEPMGEASVSFSTLIPEDLEESDEYYIVLCDADNNIIDRTMVEMNFVVSVSNIVEEEVGHYRYFDLQGVEVSGENLMPGIYIRTDGTKSDKILVK